jgi:glycosyltransferase involved in cell wall biosynthesis
MDILIFHNSFLPEYNGSTIRLYNLISILPYNFSIITPKKPGQELSGEKFFGNTKVKRVSFQPPNSIYNVNLLRYNYRKKFLIKNAESERFDIIQSISMPLFMAAAKELSERYKKPLIIDFRVYENELNLSSLYNSYLIRVAKILDSADHLITLTPALKNWALINLKIPEEKITVINNGVDIQKFAPNKTYEPKSEKTKDELGLEGKVVMYAGYMDNINGVGDLIDIIPSIIKKSDVSFVFIGDGPEKNRLCKLSEDFPQIKFLGTVHMDEMPYYYQMSDVFLIPRPSTLPSETITPLKLLEVMAMEKTVLGSNVGGISEVINDGKNGYLFEKGDLNSFKNKLIEILDLNNDQVSKNARRTIVNAYNWDKSSQRLDDVYKKLK